MDCLGSGLGGEVRLWWRMGWRGELDTFVWKLGEDCWWTHLERAAKAPNCERRAIRFRGEARLRSCQVLH